MKAIAVVVVLSENRPEGLVWPVYMGDGRGRSRDAPGLQTPLRWGTPRRKTALPGASPAGEWMVCGSGGLARTSRTSWTPATPRRSNTRPSTSRTTPRTRPPERCLATVPTLDLRSQPEAWPPAPKVQDRSRHVRITAHVQAHCVAVGEPEVSRDVMRVNEVFQGYAAAHEASLAALPGGLSARVINSVRTGT